MERALAPFFFCERPRAGNRGVDVGAYPLARMLTISLVILTTVVKAVVARLVRRRGSSSVAMISVGG